MANFQFDENKNFKENSSRFLEAIKSENPKLAAILCDNWDALVVVVREGEKDLRARSKFNSAVATALDSIVNSDELRGDV